MTVARSIFISYRRQDSIDVTGRIYDRLVAQFGSENIFKDVDAIPFGVDFRKHLEREVSHCPALLAIIGPNWFDITDSKGNRRLDNPSDWVRIEIETALNRDSVVIPVLVGGAKLPRDSELPDSLKGLAYRQSAQIRHDPDFHRDVDRLLQRIEDVFTSLTLANSPPTAAGSTSPPYATLIDDLATALATATHSAQPSSRGAISRRRWLRLMGLGLVGTGGALAARRWAPDWQLQSLRLPHPTTWPGHLRSALPTPPTENGDTPGAASTQHTYTSVTVNEFGMRLYQTHFSTNFYEEVLIDSAEGAVALPLVAISGSQFLYGNGEVDQTLEAGQLTQTIGTVESFWMGIYPVTQAQWRAVAQLPAVNRPLNAKPAYFEGDDLPVEQVSWHEAVEFCQRLSHHTGQRFRLPQEVEWEFACRAKTTTPFHFGQTVTTDLANYDGTQTFRAEPGGTPRGQTTPVGYFQVANDFGLYDMHGNVQEWCADPWEDPFPGEKDEGNVPVLPQHSPAAPSPPPADLRVVRGGSWQSPPRLCQSAFRSHHPAAGYQNTIGFRVLREINLVQVQK